MFSNKIMNINLMRKIDSIIGRILCFIFSIYEKIKKLFIRDKKMENPKKILFIELSEMGSLILSYPLLKKTKEKYPNSELYFLTFEKNKPALEILNIIKKENIFTIKDDSMKNFIIDNIKFLKKIRKNKIDTCLDLELFARYSNLLNYLSGAKNRVGFDNFKAEGLYRGNLLSHRIYYNPYYHISLNFLSLIESLEEDNLDIPLVKKEVKNNIELPELNLNKKEIYSKISNWNKNFDKNKKIIIFNHYAGDLKIRAWPKKNFIELGKKILQNSKNQIIIIGPKKAKKDSNKIFSKINSKNCIDLTGKTSFKEMIEIFGISNLLISIDSGPPHFAALTKLPSIILFGPETPKLYSPLNKNAKTIFKNFNCSPCLNAFNSRNTLCKNNKCLKNISVKEIYKETEKMLNNENY